MELLLNLLWVTLALATTVIWRTRWARLPLCTRRSPLQQWTALGCELLFLFFAISMSDDLRAETVFTEDARQRPLVVSICLDHSSHHGLVPYAGGGPMLPDRGDVGLLPVFQGLSSDPPLKMSVVEMPYSFGRSAPTCAVQCLLRHRVTLPIRV